MCFQLTAASHDNQHRFKKKLYDLLAAVNTCWFTKHRSIVFLNGSSAVRCCQYEDRDFVGWIKASSCDKCSFLRDV